MDRFTYTRPLFCIAALLSFMLLASCERRKALLTDLSPAEVQGAGWAAEVDVQRERQPLPDSGPIAAVIVKLLSDPDLWPNDGREVVVAPFTEDSPGFISTLLIH